MNPPPSSLENRLLELLVATRESEDQAARAQLNDLLRENPAARAAMARLLVDEQALINRLRRDGMIAMLEPKARITGSPRMPSIPHRSLRKTPKPARGWPALAAAAVLLLSGYLGWRALRPPSAAGGLASTQPVAVLKEDADAVWKGSTPRGSLVPGTLKLESGMAAIEFISGARVLLEGPAELELVSGMEAFCRSGNLRAHVPPPAQGFTIGTPSSRIVDRGTVFGLSVRNDGGTLVKVMQGEVELRHPRKVYQIKTNAAAMVGPDGNPTPVTTPDEAFPSEENFNERITAGARRSAERWQSTTGSLAQDPATLLSYNFREARQSSRSVRNHAANAGITSHGSLVGTGWSDGRWPGKRALEFTGRGDSLLFKLEGRSKAVTLLAWVRVDSLANTYQILLMPDAYRRAALSWMIDGVGNLRLAITNGQGGPGLPSGWEGPVKAPAVSNLDLGRWIFLASTYDSTTGLVCHYRDGERIGTGTFQGNIPVVHKTYTFGNWDPSGGRGNPKQTTERYRNFNGRLDEIAILGRAMTAGELLGIYQAGKP